MEHNESNVALPFLVRQGKLMVNLQSLGHGCNAILILLQIKFKALGIVCVGISAHDFGQYSGYQYNTTTRLFFLLMVTTFMIASFILLLSCLASLSTGSIISKTIYVSIEKTKNNNMKTVNIDYHIQQSNPSIFSHCRR